MNIYNRILKQDEIQNKAGNGKFVMPNLGDKQMQISCIPIGHDTEP